jgi:hypothetical protein
MLTGRGQPRPTKRRSVASGYFRIGNASGNIIKNHGNHHSRAANTRLPVTDCRIYCDAVVPSGLA